VAARSVLSVWLQVWARPGTPPVKKEASMSDEETLEAAADENARFALAQHQAWLREQGNTRRLTPQEIVEWNRQDRPGAKKRPLNLLERRERRRQACYRWYWRDPEHARELRNNSNARHPGRKAELSRQHRERLKQDPLAYEWYLRSHREYYATHLDEYRQHNQRHWANNRETLIAKKRAKRAKRPGYRGQEAISRSARLDEDILVRLRLQDLSWPEISERTHRTPDACQHTFRRAMKRRGQWESFQQQRLAQQQERDAHVLSTYHEGMRWAELARQLGYASQQGARAAYYAAFDRATRPSERQQEAG